MELVGREQSTRPSTVNDEEAVKKNTDCIYFLASPLTCKKGNECEYRHSENARMNPRDCFYWLNRNCLNPKCSFRHPPLDPLVGTPLSTSSSGHFPLVQSALPAQVPAVNASASHNPNKQNVPCIFFQKGFCLKGDKCPFMHGPQPTSNPLPQQASPFVAPEQPQAFKKATTWELEKCGSQQKLPQANIHKFVQALPMTQSVIKAESLPVSGAKKNMPLPRLDEGHPRINLAHVLVVNNNIASRTATHRVPPQDDHYPNGSLGEFRVESSPGFDVRQKREHFHAVDDIGRERNHHGRSKSSEFDHRSSDHDSLPISKREMYAVRSDYDQFSLEQRRPSSERILERPALPERRGYLRGENPDHIDQLDLRHRLAKKTKFNGSRSILTPESRGEYHRGDAQRDEDRRIRGHSFRDRPPLASEGSISNRLQGRIKLPGVPSTDDRIDLHVERDIDRVRSRRRMSPPSRTIKSHQEREHDRIKHRGHEELATEGRNSSDFAAPKTLAELKGTKASEGIQETSSHTNSSARLMMNITDRLGKSLDHQDSESSLSFEGPKPLSMILKRKRETTSENGELSGNDAEEHRRQVENLEGTEATESEKGALDAEKPDIQAVEEEEKEEGLFTVEGEDEYHNVQYSFSKAGQEMDDSNRMEDGDAEAYEEGDGEFEYEQVEGGEDADPGHEEEYYEEIEGGEDVDVGREEEYFDDDDEDDFAKKVGIILS